MSDLRRILDKLIQAALRAADPREAIRRHVRRHVRRDGDALYVDHARYDLTQFDDVRLIAAGKASVPMAEEVVRLIGDRLTSVVVVTKHGHGTLTPTLSLEGRGSLIEAGHPIPDEHSLRGGQAVCEALVHCTERTLVIVCVSGGASALLVAPHAGISLGTLRAINDALLRSGADIREMNAVRSRLDRLKGGGLVRLAQPATVVGLILSDVIGDPLDVIASGLTNEPRAHNVLVDNNTQACNAVADAARDLGLVPHVMTTELRGEARAAAQRIVADLTSPSALSERAGDEVSGRCLIYGGETTVLLRQSQDGEGKGGRNQELALAAALSLSRLPFGEGVGAGHQSLGLAALGTDGTDGPTDAAGALAFTDTIRRASALGLDANAALNRNDSYHFFQPLGDLIVTGPTGTNVADVVIAVALR